VQELMCKERTPMLACVLPIFEFLISRWKNMLDKPGYAHIRPMLEAGLDKCRSLYNEHRFNKTTIFAIGMPYIVLF